MKKEKFLTLILVAFAMISFNSCDDDNTPTDVTPDNLSSIIAYTAGAGNYKANDGTVGAILYNRSTGTYSYQDIYTISNQRGIGDAQDVLLLDNDLYVSCTTSSKIEVLDATGKVTASWPMPNKEPRYLASDGTNVYASAYSGYVYKLNASDGITDSVYVGSHPEAMSVANGKLYVNMSDYNFDNSGHSISVVDLRTFTKKYELSCELNPYNQSIAVGNKVYFVSAYHSEKTGHVQCIDATNDQITSVCDASAIAYNPNTNAIIGFKSYYVTEYEPEYKSTFVYDGLFSYSLSTGNETKIDASQIKSPQQVNVDRATGNIYVIDNPSYTTPSVLYIFDQTGKLLQGNITLGYSIQNIRFPQSYN